MNKNFVKSLSAGILGLSLVASCSHFDHKDSNSCKSKNKCSSKKEEATKCSATKKEEAAKTSATKAATKEAAHKCSSTHKCSSKKGKKAATEVKSEVKAN
jgi:hypothetical protein